MLHRLDYGLRVPASLLDPRNLGGETPMCSPRGGHGVAYKVRAKLRDGTPLWSGWFYNRREMLVFIAGIREHVPVFDLPCPFWSDLPYGIYEVPDVLWAVDTVTFLTSPTGSNQTWTKPSDWDNSNNHVETIGGGGKGSGTPSGATGAAGGGGGAYSRTNNITLSGDPTYQIGAQAGDTWFNGATLGASSVGSKGGSSTSNQTGGAGGVDTSGVGGAVRRSGGTGANGAANVGGGGGGAAGPNGVGGNGSGTSGGAGDGGSGGAGGVTGSPPTAGGNGTEWDATHGSGGGGGARGNNADTGAGADGGSYGGAGGGSNKNGVGTQSNGQQGIIVTTYTPLVVSIYIARPLPF